MIPHIIKWALFVGKFVRLFLATANNEPFLLDLQPQEFTTIPPVLEGPLAINNKLDSAEKLYLGQLPNPESIDTIDGTLYTGLDDGRIVELKDGKIRTVTRIGGDDCDKKRSGCGRPNGVRFDTNGDLIVADALKGLYKVDVTTGTVTTLFDSQNNPMIEGKRALGPNNPHAAKNGDVYFSDATTKWDMFHNFNDFVEVAPNGRILLFDAQSKTTSVLVDNLYFPNGVQLSPDEDFLLIAQSSKYNILKYHLKGPKQGQLEVLIDNLPGIPDNIRTSPRGTFWLGFVGARLPGNVPLFETLGPHPFVRKLIGQFIHIASITLSWLSESISAKDFKATNDALKAIQNDLYLGQHYGFVMEFDANGTILRSLQSPSGHIFRISHALEYEDVLYLGSPNQNYIAKVLLDK